MHINLLEGLSMHHVSISQRYSMHDLYIFKKIYKLYSDNIANTNVTKVYICTLRGEMLIFQSIDNSSSSTFVIFCTW